MSDGSTATMSVSRRDFLKTAGATAGVGSLAGCLFPMPSGSGAGGRVSAGGVGAGFAYNQPAVSKSQATHVVRTANQLDAALDVATPESPSVVWIPPDAAVNYTGRTRRITNAVIASTRQSESENSESHPGGIIYSNSMGADSSTYNGGEPDGMFELGENARLTGIRLRGPTSQTWNSRWFPGFIPFASGGPQRRENFREARFARGVTVTTGSARIDNVECYGWSTQGIVVNCPRCVGVPQNQSYPRLIALSTHDCGLSGYGYGVEIIMGHPIIRQCYLGACRHVCAGYGYPSGGYSLINSFISPVTILFPIDYHNLGENIGGSSDPSDPRYRYRAGGLIRVIGCSIAADKSLPIAATESISAGGNPFAGSFQPAISIQGIPWKRAVIKNNVFVHSSVDEAISQSNIPATASTGPHGFARFEISGNEFGWKPGFPVG